MSHTFGFYIIFHHYKLRWLTTGGSNNTLMTLCGLNAF